MDVCNDEITCNHEITCRFEAPSKSPFLKTELTIKFELEIPKLNLQPFDFVPLSKNFQFHCSLIILFNCKTLPPNDSEKFDPPLKRSGS